MSDVSEVPLGVFFWLADMNACGTYRGIQPLKTMAKKHDVQVEVAGASTLPYSVLVAQRTHKEDCVDLLEYLKTQRPKGIPKLIYELDDDLWSIERDNPGYAYYMENNVYNNGIRAIELCDAVTVSTEPLAEVVRKWNPNVYVLPNSIPARYLNELRYPYKIKSAVEPFVFGWGGGSTHRNDFKTIASSVDTYLRFHPNSRFVFFGTSYAELLSPAVHEQVRVAPWTDSVDKYRDLLGRAQVDVMLAPLTVSRFNESKSNLRIIEAAALGIPTIAVNFGPYAHDRNPGTLYVNPGESWVSQIADMANSPMKRLEMSAAGRRWVDDRYTQEKNCDLWYDTYKEVLAS